MTEPTVPLAPWPSPAPALEARFRAVLQQQMQDMPLVNPALRVEAVAFRPWAEHWLGVLVTPWFMSLWLMPRLPARWQPVPERESRPYVFPAGVFDFIGGRDAVIGDYQACSLFSPMFEFAYAGGARATAEAALAALFGPDHRTPGPPRPAPPAASVSKRGFLFGSTASADHGH
jgi:[NiFe] hydrogenase assembly HybE family chaperone